MDTNLVIGIVVLIALVTVSAIKLRPDTVRTYFFEPLEQGRLLGAGLIVIILVWTWLQSGIGWKVVTAMVLVAFSVAFIVFEQPHKEVR